jgi:hypothetical protein
MTPEQLRARADREERVYAAPDLAKMLRAGAAAMEERDRLRMALEAMLQSVCGPVGFAEAVRHNTGLALPWHSLDDAEALARAALALPAEAHDFNDSRDAKWEVTK